MDTETAGGQSEGAVARQHDAPELKSVYSMRAFSSTDPFDEHDEFHRIAHLALLLPIYLLPHLSIPAPYGPCLYCLQLPLLLCAFNSVPKPATALVHLFTVPLFGLLPPSQVAERYLSVEVLAAALALFLVVGLDKWSELAAYTAQTVCARYGLRRGQLFLMACVLSFAYALILPDTVVAVTMIYYLDRVFSTIYKEDMDRPHAVAARASSLQGSQSLGQYDSVSHPSLARLENEVLFERLTEAMDSFKKTDSKKRSLIRALKTASADDSPDSGTASATGVSRNVKEAKGDIIPAVSSRKDSVRMETVSLPKSSRRTSLAPFVFLRQMLSGKPNAANPQAKGDVVPAVSARKDSVQPETVSLPKSSRRTSSAAVAFFRQMLSGQPNAANPQVDLQTVTCISTKEANDAKSSRDHNTAQADMEQSGATHAQAGPSTDTTNKEHPENQTPPPLHGERLIRIVVDTSQDAFNEINPFSLLGKQEPPMGIARMAPNTRQPPQGMHPNFPTTTSQGRLDKELMPYAAISRRTSMQPKTMRNRSYSLLPWKRRASQYEHTALGKPRETSRSSLLPESTMNLWRRFSILGALARRSSSIISFSKKKEQPKASEDHAIGGIPAIRSDIWESAAVSKKDHRENLTKMATLKKPSESAEMMAQTASAQKVELVNCTSLAVRAFPGSTSHPVETPNPAHRALLPEDAPASVKSSKKTGSPSEHPPNNPAPAVDTASVSPSSRDSPWLKSRSTSKDMPMPAPDSSRKKRRTRAPSFAGVDPGFKGEAPGSASKSSTPHATLNLSTPNIKLHEETPGYHLARVSTIKLSVDEFLPDFPTDPLEVQKKISKKNDANAGRVPSKDDGVKVEKKVLGKLNKEDDKELFLTKTATDAKGAERQVQGKVSDNNTEVVQIARKKNYENVYSEAGNEGKETGKNTSSIFRKQPQEKMKKEREEEGDDRKSGRKTRTKKGGDRSSKKGRRSIRLIADVPSRISGSQSPDTKETAEQVRIPFETSPFANYHREAFGVALDVALDVERELSVTANETPSSRADSMESVKYSRQPQPMHYEDTVPIQLPSQLVDSSKPETPEAASAAKSERGGKGAKSAKKKTTRKSSDSSSSSSKSGVRNSSKASKGYRLVRKTPTDTEAQTEKDVDNVDRTPQLYSPKNHRKEKHETVPGKEQLPEPDDSKVALEPLPPIIDNRQAVQPLEVKAATTSKTNKQRKHKDVRAGAVVAPVPPVDTALVLTPPKARDGPETAEALDTPNLPTTKESPADILSGPGQSVRPSPPQTLAIMCKRGSTGSGAVVSFRKDMSKPKKDDTKIKLQQATVAVTPSDDACPKALVRRRPSILKSSGTTLAATRPVRPSSSVDSGAARFTVIRPEMRLSRAWSAPWRASRASAASLSLPRDADNTGQHGARESRGKVWRFSLKRRFVRPHSSSAFEETFSRSTFRPHTTGSTSTLYEPNMRTKRVRKEVHNAFLLGPSLLAALGGVCNYHVGGHKGALQRVSLPTDSTDSAVNGVTWVILTFPAVLVVAATCGTIIWQLYVKPHEPRPLSSLNERVMRAAELRRAQQTTIRGAHYACAACAIIFVIVYARSLLIGEEPQIALLGALVWLVLATSLVAPFLRVAFDLVRNIWQQLPWGVMLFLGATRVTSCLVQTYNLISELFKFTSDSFWERRSSFVVQAFLALFTAVMAETVDKQPLTEIMAPIVLRIAEVKRVYPAYYAVPVIVSASCNFIMPASLPLALLHDMARVPFCRLLLLGLFVKLVLVSLVIATVTIADRAGFLAPATPPE